ncbi:MAG: methyl-accepting chemotaxis protein [Gammaproteobacteria bacterium]|nr:methyl-accepting chemotaxis protein [Gammaproteobacteria bacterium]
MFVYVKTKIMSIALLPLIVALGLMLTVVLDKYLLFSEMKDHDEIAMFIVNFGDVLHEIQKERGISAVYLSNQGEKFVTELNKQRDKTNAVKEVFSSTIKEFNISRFGKEAQNNFENVQIKLGELAGIRKNVTSQVISTDESLKKYSEINKSLLKMVKNVMNFGSVSQMNQNRATYYYFIEGKERAGIERAVLSQVFSYNKFPEGKYGQFVQLIAEQDTFFDVFRNVASTEQFNKFTDFLNKQEVENTQKLRDIAILKGALEGSQFNGFGVDSSDWFKVISTKINLLKSMEDDISKGLVASSHNLKNQAKTVLFMILGFAFVLTTVVIIAVIVVVRGILTPLNMAVYLAEIISKGNLGTTLENSSQDEVGKLSRALNNMVGTLKNTIFSVNMVNDELTESAQEMSVIAQQTSSGVAKQQDELQLISTAITQMNQTTSKVSENANAAKSATYDARTEINNGLDIVTATTQSINSLSTEITKTTSVIQKLESDTTSIETVLDVIGGIAEQTNLLALNAAIEAARAGEQGRGFAVVADEVRTLAGRTQQATQEIQTMISNLQTGAVAAVSAMKEGSSITKQSVEQANSACESLNTITHAMSTVVEMNEQIADATEQQKGTIGDIETKVLSIFNVVNETAQGANKTNTTSSELLELAVNLKQSLSMFKV